MINFSIRQLRMSGFSKLYSKLIEDREMSQIDRINLLKLAIIFLNSSDSFTQEFGYRVILKYCNNYEDYIPLYNVAINMGYIPIAKYIEINHIESESSKNSFYSEFLSSFKEIFRKEDIYLTEEQYELNKFFHERNDENIAIVAPTSYGKSELILSLINNNRESNICIIVPTKSLLAQTKRRIFKNKEYDLNRKIITHPEMYQDMDENFIAVLTQERLLRLLQQNKTLCFDFVIIDEAHNILNNDSRARLLASALIILSYRNTSTIYKYLTPFLLDLNNLTLEYTNMDIHKYKIEESIKSENFYIYDFLGDKRLGIYDQYLDKFYDLNNSNYNNDIELINERASHKNIIYLNKPKDIEVVSKRFIKTRPIVNNTLLIKACEDIAKYIHNDYLLVDCLKRGIVYHHGSVPDNIRLYIEHLFSVIPELEVIITSSTLLEGVNIPADKIFILDHKKGNSKLSHAQFKNLVGRVCRFSEIFDDSLGSLKKLEPEIYLIKSEYMQSNANLKKYLQQTIKVDKNYNEVAENVLLKNTEINECNLETRLDSEEFIENQEPGITSKQNVKYASTEVGKLCFKNSITEFNILEEEVLMQEIVDKLREREIIITSSVQIIKCIIFIFINRIDENDKNRNLNRLKNESAQNFYNMFFEWKIKQASFNEMINSFLSHWNKLIKDDKDPIVYVDKWGDIIRESPDNTIVPFKKLWTDISKKSVNQRINLAIVRIKEEQDFIENNLMKFVETIYDLGLLQDKLYYQIKYGTDDENIIAMIKNGVGFQTAKLLKSKYEKFITIDVKTDNVFIHSDIINSMIENNENEIVIFEVSGNIKNNSI